MSAAQERRPGLRALAESIQHRNPSLSFEAAAAIAKQQWTLRAFDQLAAADRREAKNASENVRQAARSAL